MISPAAAKILALFPDPGAGAPVLNNFVGSGSGPFNSERLRHSHRLQRARRLKVFGRFSLDYFNLRQRPAWALWAVRAMAEPAMLPVLSGSSIDVTTTAWRPASTRPSAQQLLTDFRFGYFKYNPQTSKPDGGTPDDRFGIPGANPATRRPPAWAPSNLGRIRSAATTAHRTMAATGW